MPTGYTAAITEGDGISPRDFIMRCARAFGAFIMARDEALDAEVPLAFEPSAWNRVAAEKARVELSKLMAMSEAELSEAAQADYRKNADGKADCIARAKEANERYRAMRAAVEAWVPPTPEHANLRTFMLEQIDTSMETESADWWTVEHLTAAEWRDREALRLAASIESNMKYQREEDERTASRNKWIADLVASLPPAVTP